MPITSQPARARNFSLAWPIAALWVAVQASFILYSRRNDYFLLDDFLNFLVARTSGMNRAYLMHDVFGQFAPGFRIVAYSFTFIFGLHYDGVHLFDIVTIGTTTLLLISLARCWRVPMAFLAPAMAFIPFSPIFSITLQWFASAIHVFDSMVWGTLTLRCVAIPESLSLRRRVAGACVFAVALIFYAKTLFLSVPILGIRMFVARLDGLPVRPALWRAIRELAFFVPVVLAYLSIVILGHYTSGRPPTGIAPVLAFARIGFVDGFACNLFGLAPTLPGQLLACILVLLPMAVSVMRRPWTGLIWAAFLAQFFLGMVAVAYGRVTLFGAESAALSRYHAEMVAYYLAYVLICFGNPSWKASAARGLSSSDWRGLAAALAIVLYLGHASLTTPIFYGPDDGQVAAYVANFRHSLKTAGNTPIYDGTVPDWVMVDWSAPLNRMRYFALLFPPGPKFSENKTGVIVIDPDGNGQLAAH